MLNFFATELFQSLSFFAPLRAVRQAGTALGHLIFSNTIAQRSWIFAITAFALQGLHGQASAAILKPGALRDGTSAIFLEGAIKQGDGVRLRELLALGAQQGRKATILILNSVGGSVVGGADLAMVVRRQSLATSVGDGATCASSCFMPFIAGMRRFTAPSAKVGVHSVTNVDFGEDISAKSTTVDMVRLLAEFGTPHSILGKLVSTPPESIVWLNGEELRLISTPAVFPPAAKQYIESVETVFAPKSAMPRTAVSITDVSSARRLNAEGLEAMRTVRVREQLTLVASLFERAQTLSPYDAEILGNYGYVLYLQGNAKEAIRVLALALEIRPKRGSSWVNLGQALSYVGDISWATDCLVKYYHYSSKKDLALWQLRYFRDTNPQENIAKAAENALQILNL